MPLRDYLFAFVAALKDQTGFCFQSPILNSVFGHTRVNGTLGTCIFRYFQIQTQKILLSVSLISRRKLLNGQRMSMLDSWEVIFISQITTFSEAGLYIFCTWWGNKQAFGSFFWYPSTTYALTSMIRVEPVVVPKDR